MPSVVLLAGWLCAGSMAHGATFVIVSADAPGVGFNDTTSRAPIGGNTGTTLGQQRLNSFQFAANLWGAELQSSVPIRVRAFFHQPSMPCDANSAQLGEAGPTNVFESSQSPNFPLANTWYPQALANSIAGSDLSGGDEDIEAKFSDRIDAGCFSNGAPNGWYYGFDGNPGAGQLDLIPVLLHELCHGLGFLTFMDVTTGALMQPGNGSALNDVFEHFLKNNTTGVLVPNMTSNAERLAAITNPGNLLWTGPNVEAHSGFLAAGRIGSDVLMYSPPAPVVGTSVSHFDVSLTPDELMEPYATEHPQRILATQVLKDIGWTLNGAAPTPTPTALPCVGDCDSSGRVTIDEILTMVNIALGNGTVAQCLAGDSNNDGQITVDEVLAAVYHALNGCS